MRVLPRVAFHGGRRATVGVAFAQHWVNRTADALAIAGANCLFFVGLWIFRKVGDFVALPLQFADTGDELALRRTDVGQLDDVGIGQQRQTPQLGKRVGHPLCLGQKFWKCAQHARRHRNVAGNHVNARRRREGLNNGQEGRRGQRGCLIGNGVNDGRLGAHRGFPVMDVGSGRSPRYLGKARRPNR